MQLEPVEYVAPENVRAPRASREGDIYFPGAEIYPDTAAAGPLNGAGNLGNSLVRVKDTGNAFAVQSAFTPFDTRAIASEDRSLGSMGGIPLLVDSFGALDAKGRDGEIARYVMSAVVNAARRGNALTPILGKLAELAQPASGAGDDEARRALAYHALHHGAAPDLGRGSRRLSARAVGAIDPGPPRSP